MNQRRVQELGEICAERKTTLLFLLFLSSSLILFQVSFLKQKLSVEYIRYSVLSTMIVLPPTPAQKSIAFGQAARLAKRLTQANNLPAHTGFSNLSVLRHLSLPGAILLLRDWKVRSRSLSLAF